MAFINERQSNQIEQRQQQLNRGMMGAEGQQISGRVLQDLGVVAQQSAPLRRVLAKHGYEVARPDGAAPASLATNLPVAVTNETVEAAP